MLERATILLGIALAVVAVTLIVRAWSTRRLHRLQSEAPAPLWSALGERPDGRPSLVVFSAPGCKACRSTQHPAVESVVSAFGSGLRVLSIDMAERPAVGRAFNVLTAPTTVVLDGGGKVRSINHGFAPADVLAAQITALGA
jgi:thiol-disulfide isomerase/thioredoxin